MTGPEHFREAEHCIKQGCAADERGEQANTHVWLDLAQVHATLALAAATALNSAVGDGMPRDERAAWRMAAGTKAAPAVKPVEGEEAA